MRNKQFIIEELLKSTMRPGIYDLIKWMENNYFFTSPCSSKYHLCLEGGLAQHSLNVYEEAMKLSKALNFDISNQSIIICSILHDLGKAGDYNKQNYVPNLIKNKKKGDGVPVLIQSTTKPYEKNKALLSVDHEVRSIKIANRFIELTEQEEYAILMHNGMYGNFKYQLQGHETPLYLILHFADMWCSRVKEV